jgi:DNA-binding MarR family transcriptional regulator
MTGRSAEPSPEKQTVVGILEAADRVRRHFQGILEPRGLTVQQYNVLRILRGAGEDGLPTLEIGERMIEKTPGVTRLLDRLEQRGWVTRERSSRDRRRVVCRLTRASHELLEDLDNPIAEGDKTCAGGLTRREQKQLQALIARVGP